IRTKGDLADSGAVGLFTAPAADVHVDERAGTLDADLAMSSGVFDGRSRVVIAGDHARVTDHGIVVEALGPFRLSALRGGDGGRAVLEGGRLAGRRSGSKLEPIDVREASVALTSSSRDVTKPWELASPRIDVGAATATDLRSALELVGVPAGPLHVESG